MGLTARNLMAVFGAVYEVDLPRDTWLRGVLEAMAVTLTSGQRVSGVLYDLSGKAGELCLEAIEGIGFAPAWFEMGIEMHRDPRLVPAIAAGYRSTLCATLPDLRSFFPRAARTARRDYHSSFNIGSQTAINGLDCSGKGCCLYIFSKNAAPLSPSRREMFTQIATHLATGYRLQRRLTHQEGPVTAPIEAVLKPSGDLEDVKAPAQTAPARELLRHAVRTRESNRRCTDADPVDVVEKWRGLIAARWTLVDRYERDGRRYVLARENAPAPRGPATLSTREQQVAALAALGRSNKLISYELGLAHSTVRVLISRACAKLAVTSGTELVSRLALTPPM